MNWRWVVSVIVYYFFVCVCFLRTWIYNLPVFMLNCAVRQLKFFAFIQLECKICLFLCMPVYFHIVYYEWMSKRKCFIIHILHMANVIQLYISEYWHLSTYWKEKTIMFCFTFWNNGVFSMMTLMKTSLTLAF